MELKVEVLAYKGRPPLKQSSASFQREKVTIGRSPDNDLHLTDPDLIISSKHASILFEDNSYHIQDHSTNGTVLSTAGLELHDNRHRLKDGDELEIGEYRLKINIDDGSGQQVYSPQLSPFEIDQSDVQDPVTTESPGSSSLFSSSGQTNEVKPPEVFDSHMTTVDHYDPPSIESPSAEKAFSDHNPPSLQMPPEDFNPEDLLSSLGGQNVTEQNSKPLIPPITQVEHGLAPDADSSHFDSSGFESSMENIKNSSHLLGEQSPPPREARAERADPQSHNHDSLQNDYTKNVTEPRSEPATSNPELTQVLLESLGIIDGKQIPSEEMPEFIQTVGFVFRELVEGLRTVLRARAESKAQITGIMMTMVEIERNNPLKFSPTVEDAIKLLLLDSKSGFLDPVSSIRDGYEDVKNHQLAVSAGVQATLQKLLNYLDPHNFEKKGIMGKSHSWEAYTKAYNDLVKEAPKTFFDQEFAKAYLEFMSKINDAKRKS